jgi:hypothetical protein
MTMLRVVCALSILLVWPSPAVAQAHVPLRSAGQAGDADPTSLQMLADDDAGSATCGSYLVSWNNVRSFDSNAPGSVTLRATTPGGRLVIDLSRPLAAGERLLPLWCGDLLGDGSQALGYEAFSGGAHCCFSATVISLDSSGRHLLDADLGNGGLGMPTQLDDGGPLELPASSDVFAYFADLSFAASPFLPMVLVYDGTQYVEATRQFPDRLSAEIDQAEADLADAVARPVPADEPRQFAYQEQESVALRLFGLHVLLGDADQALPAIERGVAPPVAMWLSANASAARAAMAERYTLTTDE